MTSPAWISTVYGMLSPSALVNKRTGKPERRRARRRKTA